MSQYNLSLPYLGNNAQATLGYDRILDQFFLDIYQDGEHGYTSLTCASFDSLDLANALAEHKVVLPDCLYADLTLDAMGLSQANKYKEVTLETLSPLETKLSELKGIQVLESTLGAGGIKVLWALSPPNAENQDELDDLEFVGVEMPSIKLALPAILLEDTPFAHINNSQDTTELSDEEGLALLSSVEGKWMTMRSEAA